MTDTIFALASAPGRAAIAVLRISGPDAGPVLEAIAGRRPEPRRASVARLRDADGDTIDQAVAIWFAGPHSFTGEDAAELHLHGGPAVVDAVTSAVAAAGARLATPGEFTRRAFANGKLDLAQAEAVADLIDAETEAQRRQALAQLDGALGSRHREWREALIEILALLEAEIDFPDEDVPEAISLTAGPLMDDLAAQLDAALAETARGERIRSGYRVALIGAPNAGKSSLLNALLGRDAAIVTEIPGTTRDVIEAPLVLAGYKLLLADTAGLRPTDELVEREGVRRARSWAKAADLRLLVVDRSGAAGAWREAVEDVHDGDILVLNKSDLPKGADVEAVIERTRLTQVVDASVRSEPGLAALLAALQVRVISDLSGGDFPAATRLRHEGLIREARDSLDRARRGLSRGAEIAAAEVHLASQALSRITGGVDNEAVLDRVFSSFCIGK